MAMAIGREPMEGPAAAEASIAIIAAVVIAAGWKSVRVASFGCDDR